LRIHDPGDGLLKLSGCNKGLEGVSEAPSARFSRSRRPESAPAA